MPYLTFFCRNRVIDRIPSKKTLLSIKSILLVICFGIISTCQLLAYDHIIFRDGQEYDVKLHQITNDKVIYSPAANRSILRQEVPSTDVYMVYIEKQGNVYITKEGKRITGEPIRIDPKKFDVIYLVSGAEIGADDVRITEDRIIYKTQFEIVNNKLKIIKKKKADNLSWLPKSDVFMIRYKSGMVDIVTPIEHIEPEPVVEETVGKDDTEPQYIVIFHTVSKGETLNKISEKFNVSVDDIAKWNDLPSKIKPSTPLTVDMQLMIYQPKNK